MNKTQNGNRIDFDSILQLIDFTISPNYLNKTQEIVLREVWDGKTYARIADDYNYEPEYIKTVGCNLWQTLSNAFNEQINKGNFVPFMRRKATYSSENKKYSQLRNNSIQSTLYKPIKQKKYYWNTAPSTDIFWGREKECELLESWSQELECQCIMVSGMVGSGKTTLVTEFSKGVREKYDYVIWYSLYNPLPLVTLICNYLDIISPNSISSVPCSSNNISILISRLVNSLKEKKVLLILDGLENVLDINNDLYYKAEFEDYSQFIRSIISANHQSLLICTTQVLHKSFRYYSSKRIKLMEISGLPNISVKKNYDENICALADPDKLLQLYNGAANNPEIINIFNKNLSVFKEEDNLELLMHQLSYVDEIAILLEKEIKFLSNTEREIIYWLSTSCACVSFEELSTRVELSKPKFQLTQSLDYLEKRNLITKEKSSFALMPIMKSYLRRKIIYQSLNTGNCS